MVVWWIFKMTRQNPHFVSVFCSAGCIQLVRSQAAGALWHLLWMKRRKTLGTGGTAPAHKAPALNAQVRRSKMHEIKRLLGLCPFFFVSHLWLASWWGVFRDALFAWSWRGGLEPDLKWPVWLAKGQQLPASSASTLTSLEALQSVRLSSPMASARSPLPGCLLLILS